MKRTWMRRIVMPLLILIVACVLLYIGRGQESRHDDEVRLAARELIAEVAAAGAPDPAPGPAAQRMNASRGTLSQLARVLEAQPPGVPGLDLVIERGDADPPYGDGRATHRAFISVQGTMQIALRFHHPGDPARIEVLGYWVP